MKRDMTPFTQQDKKLWRTVVANSGERQSIRKA